MFLQTLNVLPQGGPDLELRGHWRQNLPVAKKGMTYVLAIENEQREIRLMVLKSGAGGMEYITDIFWRAIKNDVAIVWGPLV